MTRKSGVVLLIALLSGCGSLTVDYENALVEVRAAPVTSEVMAVAVWDQRSWVLNKPKLLGVARTTMGIPLDVNTASGRDFDQDVSSALCTALQETGYNPVAVEVDPGQTPEEVVRALRESGHQRWLLVEVGTWRSDGYFGELTVDYRLAAKVYASGELRSTARREGEETRDYANRSSYPGVCRQLFGEIFGSLLAEIELAPPLVAQAAQETETAETCAKCNAELQAAWRVCPICATPR